MEKTVSQEWLATHQVKSTRRQHTQQISRQVQCPVNACYVHRGKTATRALGIPVDRYIGSTPEGIDKASRNSEKYRYACHGMKELAQLGHRRRDQAVVKGEQG